MSIFGNLLTLNTLHDAVESTLRTWVSTDLDEVERLQNITAGTTKRPATIRPAWTVDEDQLPGERLPALLFDAGALSDFQRQAGGVYAAVAPVTVRVIVKADRERHARQVLNDYLAAVTAAMVHHPDLGGVAQGVRPTSVTADPGSSSSLAAATVSFDVRVNDVVTEAAGPDAPHPPPDQHDPHPDLPLVDEASTTFIGKPASQPVGD